MNKIEKLKTNKLLTKNDIIFYIVLVLVVLFGFLVFYFISSEGNAAEIYSNNKLVMKISLNIPATHTIKNGDHYNIIIVKDGKISVSESDCGDKICIKYKFISSKNQTIVCLPNNLKIVIIGTDGGIGDIWRDEHAY